MRHIPEDELHAYLDQALSRSQCIEIETHLSGCATCHHQRDTIAALRDHTTALLALAAPRVRQPPPLESLREQIIVRRQLSWRRRALWAASLAGAVLGGWGLRAALDPHTSTAPAAVATLPSPAVAVPTTAPAEPAPSIPTDVAATSLATRPPAPAPDPTLRLAGGTGPTRPAPTTPPAASEDEAVVLGSGWQSVSLAEAQEATSNQVPTVPDLPIVGLWIRPVGNQERPLVMVMQRDPSGAVIHTFEGPVDLVATTVASQLDRDFISSEPSRTPPDYVDGQGGVRRTYRVLALVGRLSQDSLNALQQVVVLR